MAFPQFFRRSFLFRPVPFAAAAALLVVGSAPAALPGAWEDFATQANANAWELYDWSDDTFYNVDWINPSSGDPYVSAFHNGDAALTFTAASAPGNGALVGDYLAANVRAIAVDVFIEDLDEFDFIDCSVYTDGPLGIGYYYSFQYFAEDFEGDGWWPVEFSFDDDWFFFEDGEWVPVFADVIFLQEIEEIGITFYPRVGSTAFSEAAIDNVVLEPYVYAPLLDHGLDGTDFELAFVPGPGLEAAVERLRQEPAPSWEEVAGQTGIREPHLFRTPVSDGLGLFRVSTRPGYTFVETAP